MTYTRAQLAAFAWLPEDGRLRKLLRRGETFRNMLELRAVPGMIEAEDMDWGIGVRLTPAGVAERARLVSDGLIE